MLEYSKLQNQDLAGEIRRYIEAGCEPGSFLSSVLENDLKGAFAHADHWNQAGLKDIVQWCYWELPGPAWGSPEKVAAWMDTGWMEMKPKLAGN